MIEKTKAVDDRKRLEKEMSVQCEEIPSISMEMFVKVKVLRLGQIVVDLKKENEELQARAVPSTLLERRSKIKEAAA